MRTPRSVLVLGGGVGGVVVANRLRKRLPRTDRVTLIDRESRHLFQPSLLWLAVGRRQPDAIQRPLAGLRRRGIDVIQGDISRIDPNTRSVVVGGQEIRGDALVIALGADLVWEGAAHTNPDGWSAEFKIPWSSLGIDPSNPPAATGFELSRDQSRLHATYDWALIVPPHQPIAASQLMGLAE